MLQKDEKFHQALAGEILYGDDLEGDALADWFAAEQEGYAELSSLATERYAYGYHALNQIHGFSRLPKGRFERVLDVGAARGDELLPLMGRFGHATLLEPSLEARSVLPEGKSSYLRPRMDSVIDASDASFDLVVCFSALHHVPKVSRAIAEMGRVTRPGGWCLLREPVISMGDWRRPRLGLTPNERGIPEPLLRDRFEAAGFAVRRWAHVCFPLTRRLGDALGFPAFNHVWLTHLDHWLSEATAWNHCYHAQHGWQKIRPNAIFAVLEKQGS